MTGARMVDADGHVTEQLELDPEVSAAFFNRLNGELPITVYGPADDPIPDEASHAELMNRPGAYQPGPRLADMDADGIDVAVLYPTTPGLGWVPDPQVFLQMSQAYNRWLYDYCAFDTSRLVGVGLVPLQDPALAVKEMQHCTEDLGFKAVMIRPAPYIGDAPLNDPVYDPFWDAAQALGCPIGVHPFSFADMPYNVVSRLGLHRDCMGDPSKGLTMRQGLGNALDVMMAMGWFVAGGICERFPRL
ncbi:MAG TPA: amidohydrolase family protein, partial [Acidimicrobiales bacterium]|nr:amidohydrolase family protein [Acidimicrobiales bacterium]